MGPCIFWMSYEFQVSAKSWSRDVGSSDSHAATTTMQLESKTPTLPLSCLTFWHNMSCKVVCIREFDLI
ncbi:hypothetical protein ACRALDRAFT_209843 [Sodiomyces alcalophilus JCM 7366]|uniref:uncharacterized protein n=1 Tax=Sodiomyces alcalophilus JCM 7366 TaxID=591952 RepID=UPI0039B5F310